MKLIRYSNKLELTNIPQTVFGVLFAVVTPVVCLLSAMDWVAVGADMGALWYVPVELGVILVIYVCWLCTQFRTRVLVWAYCFDKNGVREKKLTGKETFIPWEDVEEYVCVLTGAPHRSGENYLVIQFSAKSLENPVLIETYRFPASKAHLYRDEIFAFCDAMRQSV